MNDLEFYRSVVDRSIVGEPKQYGLLAVIKRSIASAVNHNQLHTLYDIGSIEPIVMRKLKAQLEDMGFKVEYVDFNVFRYIKISWES